jgi:hypothetical protein
MYLKDVMPIHRISEKKQTVTREHEASEVPQMARSDLPCCKVPRCLEVGRRLSSVSPIAQIQATARAAKVLTHPLHTADLP